ncbi:MAG: dihydrolipoamide acetyltransferase family protein [Candidatus Neptunochlamydia sp.]|nr:dihydrolipoamide acetyltransferase family protein [Candidatus Neptunochlamydia sp.]
MMSDEVEIKLPKLGESIVSATVVQWFKKEGDTVKLDEPLLEVSTDKVNSEIPSPVLGKVTKILANPDQELDVGASLAIIATAESTQVEEVAQKTVEEEVETPSTSSKKRFYTPVVLKIAQEKGVDLSELENIPATGAGGRLSKQDLEKYLENNRTARVESGGEVERVKMSTMRKMIADAMVDSFYTAPHATLVNEVDVTALTKQLKATKESFFKENGYKMTITSHIAKAIATAAKKYPMINASLEKDTIVIKKNVNLGIAVSVDQGILVPVIANCGRFTLKEIARTVATLSEKARTGNLQPDQVKEGTITMTNFGMLGTLIGTPIIRQPEVAILGVGAITKKIVVLDDDTMAIRSTMHLSLSFDHRVIDGMYGCEFLAEMKNQLENSL